MKWQGSHRMTMVWLGVVAGFLVGDAAAAKAEIIMSEPTNVGPPINDAYDVQECDFSHDGLELYYAIGGGTVRGYGGKDIWVSTRETLNSPWEESVNLGPNVNSAGREMEPSISCDGLELYFGSWTDYILRVCMRPSKDDPWSKSVTIGAPVGYDAYGPDISADGLSLYFASERGGGYGGDDIWVATRATRDEPWTEPVNLGPNVNSGAHDWSPSISTDGLTLAFSRGLSSIWATTRKSTDDDWGSAVNLGLTGPGMFYSPALSPDGSVLYFQGAPAWGGYGADDLWQTKFMPIVDFNADGSVDLSDLVMLIDNWGTDDRLYDIGPMPLGDGKVDIKDLKVFMTEWEKENTASSQED